MEFIIYVTKTITGGYNHKKAIKSKAPIDLAENSDRKKCVVTIRTDGR